MLIELSALDLKEDMSTNKVGRKHSDVVQKLLHQFTDVFEPTIALPPTRVHDYAIDLQPGVGPVNVRPYCYPQL